MSFYGFSLVATTQENRREFRSEIVHSNKELMKKVLELGVESSLQDSYEILNQLQAEAYDLRQLIKKSNAAEWDKQGVQFDLDWDEISQLSTEIMDSEYVKKQQNLQDSYEDEDTEKIETQLSASKLQANIHKNMYEQQVASNMQLARTKTYRSLPDIQTPSSKRIRQDETTSRQATRVKQYKEYFNWSEAPLQWTLDPQPCMFQATRKSTYCSAQPSVETNMLSTSNRKSPPTMNSFRMTKEQLNKDLDDYRAGRQQTQEQDKIQPPPEPTVRITGDNIIVEGVTRPVVHLNKSGFFIPRYILSNLQVEDPTERITVMLIGHSEIFGIIRGHNRVYEELLKHQFGLTVFITPYQDQHENRLRVIEMTGRKIDIICGQLIIREILQGYPQEWKLEMMSKTDALLNNTPNLPSEVTELVGMDALEVIPVARHYCHFCWGISHKTTHCPERPK